MIAVGLHLIHIIPGLVCVSPPLFMLLFTPIVGAAGSTLVHILISIFPLFQPLISNPAPTQPHTHSHPHFNLTLPIPAAVIPPAAADIAVAVSVMAACYEQVRRYFYRKGNYQVQSELELELKSRQGNCRKTIWLQLMCCAP